MVNHRRFPINGDPSEDGRPFRLWVVNELKAQREELKAQREELKAQRECQRRMLGMLGDVAREVDGMRRGMERFNRSVTLHLLRLDRGVAEILRRLPSPRR